MQSSVASSPTSSAWPSAARGWAVAALLALASIGSQFDRTVINLMVEPLKAAFTLDDTHFGMLQGVAFGIFYVIACVPIGRLADRYQRRLILAAGIGLFSVFACLSGLARSYTQLFLTRIGVAVGEASLTPAGLSMLSDLFPPRAARASRELLLHECPGWPGPGLHHRRRPAAMAVDGRSAAQCQPGGSGAVAGRVHHRGAARRAAGAVLSACRKSLPGSVPAERGSLPVREVLAVIRARAAALVPMFAGFAMVNLVSYTFFIWTPAFLQRTYHWNPAQIGVTFGLMLIVFGTGGVYFSGALSDRLAARGHLDAHLKVAAFGFVGCGLFGALAPLDAECHRWPCCCSRPRIFLSMMPYACAGTAIQLIVPNRARAQITARVCDVHDPRGTVLQLRRGRVDHRSGVQQSGRYPLLAGHRGGGWPRP